jgi:membrane protein
VAAALASIFGASEESARTVATILSQLPGDVASTLRDPIQEVLTARTGPLLWLGGVVGLWTAASFIETIRDILRRAYGVKYSAPFWEYRLISVAMIIGAVILMLIAFAATVILRSIQAAVETWFPFSEGVADLIGVYRVIPAAALFGTIYAIFYALTPARYRGRGCRKWPGALLITAWWLATVELLPPTIGLLGGYDLTYGSLAGVMVVLIFFFMIGLGVVMGAELNAALAEGGDNALKGEVYSGPFKDQLEVEEPQEGEDASPELVTGGQL